MCILCSTHWLRCATLRLTHYGYRQFSSPFFFPRSLSLSWPWSMVVAVPQLRIISCRAKPEEEKERKMIASSAVQQRQQRSVKCNSNLNIKTATPLRTNSWCARAKHNFHRYDVVRHTSRKLNRTELRLALLFVFMNRLIFDWFYLFVFDVVGSAGCHGWPSTSLTFLWLTKVLTRQNKNYINI